MKEDEGKVSAVFDSVFIKKVVKSRESYLVWIPKDEAEYLGIDDNTYLRVGLKRLKNGKAKN